ncbi:hypothetical protein BCR36DRAFT_315751, partial [Piromyces finnis]
MNIKVVFLLLLYTVLSHSKTCIDIFSKLGLDVNKLNTDTSYQCYENTNNEAISLELLDVDLSNGNVDVIFETPSLEILKLSSSNVLIPNKFNELPNLVEIFISNINYEQFPDSVFKLEKLKELSFNNCGFTSIPDKFNNILNLTTLRLSGNKFEFLPRSIYELKNLTTIEINRNPNFKGLALNPVITTVNNEEHKLESNEFKNNENSNTNLENNENFRNAEDQQPLDNNTKMTFTANSNYKKIDELSYSLKKAINEYNVISFDIFDTLLVRSYVRPVDLFIHMEQIYNVTGFTEARMMAERRVRKTVQGTKEDIKFDEIYEEIDERYKWLKEKELLLEYQSSNARLFIKDIYEYACQQNKKIIIISDIYLSKQFIVKLLEKNGYTNYDSIYISSEYYKTKGTGSLYNVAMEDLNLSVKDILHVGDNLFSDVNRPRKLGINAFYVPKVIEFLFQTDSRIEYFYKKYKDDIGASIMLGLLAYHSEGTYNNYWYEFGYKYAGPLILGYMQWLEQQLKKEDISKALFVARDGYTLEKVFKLIHPSEEIETHYIYLPRKIANECLSENPEIAEKSKKEYMYYLEQFDLQSKRLAVIDSVTYWFSSQRTLVHLFPEKEIKGYYWLYGNNLFNNLMCESFQNDHRHRIGEIIELIMTAPTSPVETIANGKPIFKEMNETENVRVKLYPDLSSGAINFAKDYLSAFKNLNNSNLSCDMLIEWIKIFLQRPTEIDK